MTPLSSPIPLFLPSLGTPKSTVVESETSMLDNPCLDQTLEDSDIDGLEDHFKVRDLSLSHPLSFDCHISFDWPSLGLFSSPFRDVALHFGHSDHFRWPMHSYSHIIC